MGSTSLVNGRVNTETISKASSVLQKEGLTISSYIRNSIEFVAREGSVPESGFEVQARKVSLPQLKTFLANTKKDAMPGKKDYPNISADALTEKLLMERYGY